RSRPSSKRLARRSTSSNPGLVEGDSRASAARSGDLVAKDADGRVRPGHDERIERSAGPSGPLQACKRDALEQVEHGNLWGSEDLTLESPRLPPHIGTAARKRG